MIYMVTGLQRAGKSMIMQMLQAGGIELSYDEKYLQASQFNENGFFEWENVGDKLCDVDFRNSLEGKAISAVLHETVVIPFTSRKNIKVIWVQRPLESVLHSYERVVQAGVVNPGVDVSLDPEYFYKTVNEHISRFTREVKHYHSHLILQYGDVIYHPRPTAAQLAAFTGKENFDVEAAGRVPEARLCHF